MAITATLAHVTRTSVAFLLTQDAAAGSTLTLANSDLVTPLTNAGCGGPLLDLLSTPFNPNTQAIQRTVLLGDASGIADPDLRETPFCVCQLIVRSGDQTRGWLVDADVDAVVASRGELNISGPANATTAILTVQFRHTYTR